VQQRHPLPALRRLLDEKWIERFIERFKEEESSRGRQGYRLTPRGPSHLQLEEGRMKHLTRLANLRVAVKESYAMLPFDPY
jgi:DNA-binding PadR family transcriptional regulator